MPMQLKSERNAPTAHWIDTKSQAQYLLQDCLCGQRRLGSAWNHRLIRVFFVHVLMLRFLDCPQSALQKNRSDRVDSQVDLSLRLAHVHSCRKYCIPARVYINEISLYQSPKVAYFAPITMPFVCKTYELLKEFFFFFSNVFMILKINI